jgi:protein-disulfide isomerase
MNRALTITAVFFALILGFLVVSNPGQDSQPDSADSQQVSMTEQTQTLDAETLIIGDLDAPVTIVEYIDYKCPNCNRFHQDIIPQLNDEYISDGRVNIEVRNFPFIGPDSGRSARGTYCSNDQGVFPAYHDAVLNYMWQQYYASGNLAAEIEDVLTEEVLVELMSNDLEDTDLFRSCLSDTSKNAFIDEDLLEGADHGINGTPGFAIGEQSFVGPQNYNTFKTLLDIELR